MKKVFGWIILASLLLAIIAGTCFVIGVKEGLLIWGGCLICAILIVFATGTAIKIVRIILFILKS